MRYCSFISIEAGDAIKSLQENIVSLTILTQREQSDDNAAESLCLPFYSEVRIKGFRPLKKLEFTGSFETRPGFRAYCKS
jgi:hypothetical protein